MAPLWLHTSAGTLRPTACRHSFESKGIEHTKSKIPKSLVVLAKLSSSPALPHPVNPIGFARPSSRVPETHHEGSRPAFLAEMDKVRLLCALCLAAVSAVASAKQQNAPIIVIPGISFFPPALLYIQAFN